MHKNTLKAALAAAIISVSAGAALADAAPPVVIEQSDLSIVMAQLDNTVAGVKQGTELRKITPAEAKTLDKQAMTIRRSAEQSAAKNGGKLTSAEYHQLLAQIAELNRVAMPG